MELSSAALFPAKRELVRGIIFEVERPHWAHTCLLCPGPPAGLAARGPPALEARSGRRAPGGERAGAGT